MCLAPAVIDPTIPSGADIKYSDMNNCVDLAASAAYIFRQECYLNFISTFGGIMLTCQYPGQITFTADCYVLQNNFKICIKTNP